MDSGPSSDEVMSAIRESGYLMEQHVASQLEALNYHVQTNFAFEDPEEGKSREMDVRAVRRVAHNQEAKLTAFVELIVECKNNSNPFVFITRPKNERDRFSSPAEFSYPVRYEMRKDLGGGRAMSRQRDAFFHLGFDAVHHEHHRASKAVQFCRIDRKGGGWHANHGGLYDAIFYPMAKAVTARRAELPKNSDEWKYFWFFFPLVVTSGELLGVDSSDPDAIPEARDHIGFRREIRSGKLSGTYTIDFVRQQHLEDFAARCIDPLAALALDLVDNRADFVLRSVLAWDE
jgi:hypothetical protein